MIILLQFASQFYPNTSFSVVVNFRKKIEDLCGVFRPILMSPKTLDYCLRIQLFLIMPEIGSSLTFVPFLLQFPTTFAN